MIGLAKKSVLNVMRTTQLAIWKNLSLPKLEPNLKKLSWKSGTTFSKTTLQYKITKFMMEWTWNSTTNNRKKVLNSVLQEKRNLKLWTTLKNYSNLPIQEVFWRIIKLLLWKLTILLWKHNLLVWILILDSANFGLRGNWSSCISPSLNILRTKVQANVAIAVVKMAPTPTGCGDMLWLVRITKISLIEAGGDPVVIVINPPWIRLVAPNTQSSVMPLNFKWPNLKRKSLKNFEIT